MKRVRDMIKTYSQLHRKDKYSQHSSIVWPAWLNGWVFVYKLSGCGFKSRCSRLTVSFRNSKDAMVKKKNVIEILTSHKHLYRHKYYYHSRNKSKSFLVFALLMYLNQMNEQLNSSPGWYLPIDIYSPKNLDVRSAKHCNCLGRSII